VTKNSTEKGNFLRLVLKSEIIINPALGLYSWYNRPARVIQLSCLPQLTESRYWHSKTWPSDHRHILRDRAFEIAAVNIDIFVSQNQTRCVFPQQLDMFEVVNPAVGVVSLVIARLG
jgi:hypothetical protein